MTDAITPGTSTTRGRCLCGAVTFEYSGPEAWRGHCHCESCRRSCSAPFTSFLGVSRPAMRWTGAMPAVYESSPGVRRLFCVNCGSPMAYDTEKDKADIHLYAASLEDPSSFAPTFHGHWAEKVPWVELADDLEKFPHGGG